MPLVILPTESEHHSGILHRVFLLIRIHELQDWGVCSNDQATEWEAL